MSRAYTYILFDKNEGRCLALRMGANRGQHKLFDFKDVLGADYFLRDLDPDVILINIHDFMEETPLLLAMARELRRPVMIICRPEFHSESLVQEWKQSTLEVDPGQKIGFQLFFIKLPLHPLEIFDQLAGILEKQAEAH